MKYQPSLPEDNVNVSHNHPLKEFLLLLSGLVGFVLLVFWVLGFFIDVAVDHISPETETMMFDTLSSHFNFSPGADGDQQQKLQKMLDDMQQCIELPYPIKVHLVDSGQKNAVAFPGGNILVFSGLLETLHSQNGLAFVLAHELGHFKNRDHLRSMGRGIVLVALSTLLTGANSDITGMFVPTSQFGQAQYSQGREQFADETALQTLNCLYGHVGGASEFFEAVSRHKDTSSIPVIHSFSTHPEIRKRIEHLKKKAEELGYSSKAVKEESRK